jgi:hypothetical protein
MATIRYIDKNTIRVIVDSENPQDIPANGLWIKISG